jgi:hypothetical protein
MILPVRIAMTAPALALALVAAPVQATVTFNVTGSYSDGGTLSGTFTTDDALTTLESTSLTVLGGTLGLDGVIFNDASYITAGTQDLPNSFLLLALSDVDKSLSLVFVSPLTLSGATLSTASDNYQEFVGTRTIVSGSVVNANPTSAVPEPATWAMMLLGFGGIGFQLRRRRFQSASYLPRIA